MEYINFIKELTLLIISFVGLNSITIVAYLIATYIIYTEKAFYSNETSNHEDSIEKFKNKKNTSEYDFDYKYSPFEKLSKSFQKKGIIKGIGYVMFILLPEIIASPVAEKIRKLAFRNNILFIVDILLIILMRFFITSIPDFSIFYTDILIFSYTISTVLMLVGVILIPHSRVSIYNQYIIFLTGTSFSFLILTIYSFYFASIQPLNKNVTAFLGYTFILTPLAFLLTSAKLIFAQFAEKSKTDVYKETRSLMNKEYDS